MLRERGAGGRKMSESERREGARCREASGERARDVKKRGARGCEMSEIMEQEGPISEGT